MSLCVGDPLRGQVGKEFLSDGNLHRVTYIRCCIDTIDSPDDEHEDARNM